MSEESNDTSQDRDERIDESAEPGASRSQGATNVPDRLQPQFGDHEGATAARPGFRNPSNQRTKKQKKRRKSKK